jgi:anti-anti-sigma factor
MAFSAVLEMKDKKIAQITLDGELDALSAPEFRDTVEKAASEGAKRLVLRVETLTYMASAGLRALIFAKQKMGSDVDIYIIGPTEAVTDTIQMTGFHHSVIILDEYDAKEVENI